MIGIDIIEVKRMKKALKSNPRIVDRFLTDNEKAYVELKSKNSADKKYPANLYSICGIFAAKEAILKAFGVGITSGYGFLDIEISHNKFGAPLVKLSKKLQQLSKTNKYGEVVVSISHDGEYSIAEAFINRL